MHTPLVDALESYALANKLRMHMPGHKTHLPLLGGAARLDVTEIEGLDNLHAPAGCIAEAERLAAEAFGAAHTFFLVNGSSAGLAALLLSLGEGARVLLQRDAHKSLVNGAALAGLDVTLLPLRKSVSGIPPCPAAEDVERALESGPYAAVCVTSPNYYGCCPDLARIGAACRSAGALFFVDEAHGAHFAAGAPFPAPASSRNASAWVQSAHKTLGAMTQAAYLHVSSDIDQDRVARSLSFMQSTSPSYLLMASLDYARAAFDPARWRHTAALCGEFRAAANEIGFFCPAGGSLPGAAHDPTRLVIDVSKHGGGYFAARALFEMDISVEMADARHIVLIVTPQDGGAWAGALLGALKRLPEREAKNPEAAALAFARKRITSLRKATLARTERVPLAKSAGRVAACAIGLYPPGTALVWPGEQIGENVIQYMGAMSDAGAEAFGLDVMGRACVVSE